MPELSFLGTGGAFCTAERDNSSLLLNIEGDLSLVDCPGSPACKIRQLGLEPAKVKNILVTHIHPDHVYGLPSFVHSLMLEEMTLKLFGSFESVRFCEDLLDMFHLSDERMSCRIDFCPVEPGESFSLGKGMEITAGENPHHTSSLSYCFKIGPSGENLVYSGDTPVYPPLFRSARNADYLIHDCGAPERYFKEYPQLRPMHTPAKELGQHAQEAGVKCLIPIHFLGELDYAVSEIEQEICESFSGRLIIPEDFQTISLTED